MATYWENSCSFGLLYVSWYKYLIVSLVFSHLGFWSGNLFLIAPFPDLCLLVPFLQLIYLTEIHLYYNYIRAAKPVFRVSHQARHKLACTVAEAGFRLDILAISDYPSSEIKGADMRLCFRICKNPVFS